MPLLSCFHSPGDTATAHILSAKWENAAETLGKSFQNSQNRCSLTCAITGLIGSTCSQLSVPLFLLANKQLKALSPLPVRHRAILLQSFSANSVKSILLALTDHTYNIRMGKIYLFPNLLLEIQVNQPPNCLILLVSIATSFSHKEKANLSFDMLK